VQKKTQNQKEHPGYEQKKDIKNHSPLCPREKEGEKRREKRPGKNWFAIQGAKNLAKRGLNGQRGEKQESRGGSLNEEAKEEKRESKKIKMY